MVERLAQLYLPCCSSDEATLGSLSSRIVRVCAGAGVGHPGQVALV